MVAVTLVFLFLELIVGARAGLPPPSRGVAERYDPRWNTSVQGDFPVFTFPEYRDFFWACLEKCSLTVTCGALVMKNNTCTVVPEADSENTKPEVGSTFYRRIPEKDFWKTNIIKNKYTTIPPLPSTKPPPPTTTSTTTTTTATTTTTTTTTEPVPQWRFVIDYNYNLGTKPATEGNKCCRVCLSPYANFIPTTATCECFNSINYEWFPSMEFGIGEGQVCTANPAPPVGSWIAKWRLSSHDRQFNEKPILGVGLGKGNWPIPTGTACQLCGTRTVGHRDNKDVFCYEPREPGFPGYPMFEEYTFGKFGVTTCF